MSAVSGPGEMTPDEKARARKRLVEGESWEDFCEQLKVAGRVIDAFGDEPTDQERAEWYRFLSRLARNGFERMVENCEPDRPRLRDAPWRQSINVQSPDQDHLLSEFVDGRYEYKITGNRGTLPYFIVASWKAPQPRDLAARNWAEQGVAGLREFDPATLQTGAFLASHALDFDADGNFEIRVGQKEQPGNWLPIEPDTTGILVRTVYHERDKVIPPTMKIERLDPPRPRPVEPEEVAAGLAKTGQIVLGYAELVRTWWQDNLSNRPNEIEFSEATYLSNGGVQDRLHGFGCWAKPEGQALVLRFTPPPCEHWILQVCNRWQENLDVYEDGQGYVTKFTAKYEDDGSVIAVIADEDPGLGVNWVDSFQHIGGVFSLRLIQTEGGPEIVLHEVSLEALTRDGLKVIEGVTPVISGRVTE